MENATVVLGGYNTAETLVFYIESMLLTALGLAFSLTLPIGRAASLYGPL